MYNSLIFLLFEVFRCVCFICTFKYFYYNLSSFIDRLKIKMVYVYYKLCLVLIDRFFLVMNFI